MVDLKVILTPSFPVNVKGYSNKDKTG